MSRRLLLAVAGSVGLAVAGRAWGATAAVAASAPVVRRRPVPVGWDEPANSSRPIEAPAAR